MRMGLLSRLLRFGNRKPCSSSSSLYLKQFHSYRGSYSSSKSTYAFTFATVAGFTGLYMVTKRYINSTELRAASDEDTEKFTPWHRLNPPTKRVSGFIIVFSYFAVSCLISWVCAVSLYIVISLHSATHFRYVANDVRLLPITLGKAWWFAYWSEAHIVSVCHLPVLL